MSVSVNEKNRINAPVIIAPIMLVATNSIARSITDVRIVPSMLIRSPLSVAHLQLLSKFLPVKVDTKSVTARYTTAIPKTTHKNAGVTVIAAVIVRNAVIIPSMMLAAVDNNKQLFLQLQPKLFIKKSPPIIVYAKI